MNPQEYGELSVEGRAVYIAETARAVRPSRRVDLGTLAKHAVVEKRSHDGVGKGRRVVKAVASIDFRCREITADVVSFIVAGGTLMAVAVLVSRLRSAAPSIGDEFARAGVASAFFTWVVIGGVTFVVAFVLDFVAEGRGGSRRIARVLQTP